MSVATKINVPTASDVSAKNQEIFSNLNSALGFVPNLYATMAHSENALGDFLTFSNGKTSFSGKEKEVIDLAISNVNQCSYCQAAHTAIAKGAGFTEEQTIELRKGGASWDPKLNTLARFARSFATNRGKVEDSLKEEFFAAGYNNENLIDFVVRAGVINITNTLHNLTEVEVDFPAAPSL